MKKNFKTMAAAIAVTGTMAMTMGMSMSAFAAVNTEIDTSSSFTKSGDTVSSDTSSINLIKDYILEGDTSVDNSKSPAETFTFTITPYAVWNAGSSTGLPTGQAYEVGNMPEWGTFTIGVENNQAGKTPNVKKEINVPSFNSVGDFWYQVVETNNQTTGVTYATNDASPIDRTYYLHVQVVNGANKGEYYRSVTLHKTAPNATLSNAEYNDATKNITDTNSFYNTSNKVNDIQNTYSAGTVNITKNVTGNAGDKDKRFKVEVVFTKLAGTIINSDISYSAYMSADATTASTTTIRGQYDKNCDWTKSLDSKDKVEVDTESCVTKAEIWIKHGETVTFKNVPYGVTYTVVEQNEGYSADKYENPTYSFGTTGEDGDTVVNGDTTWLNNNATGKVSDANDTVTITNKKDVTIDVGVLLSNAPYAAMLALAGTAGVVFVKRRKKDIED